LASLKRHHVKGHLYYALERSYWDPKAKETRREYLVYLGANPRDSFKVSPLGPEIRKEYWAAVKRRQDETLEAQRRALHEGREKVTSGYEVDRGGGSAEAPKKKRRHRRKLKGRMVVTRIRKTQRRRLTGLEREKLRDFVRQADPSLLDADVDSYIDSTLDYHENKKRLAEIFGLDEYSPEERYYEWAERHNAYLRELGLEEEPIESWESFLAS